MRRMTMVLTCVAVLAGLAGGAFAATDDIVVGCSLNQGEVSHLNSNMSVLEGRIDLDPTTRVAALPDGNFVTVDANQNLNIWSGTDRSWINGIATDAGVTALAVDNVMGRIAVGTSDGNVKLYDMYLSQVGSQAGFGSAINDIVFQSDASVVLCTSVNVWRLDSGLTSVLGSQSGFSSLTALAVQSDDKVVVGDSVLNGGKVWVFTSDLTSVAALEQGYGAIVDIAVQSDDDVLIATGTKVWYRNSLLTGGGYQGGFTSITALAVQSDDEVVIGDSGTGKVYLLTSDMLNHAASAQSGFGTINAVTALGVQAPPELTNLNENFEGTFLPAQWIAYKASSTWVNKYAGHDGFGGDSGYGAWLDDYNPSGHCGLISALYKTEGLAKIGFDFSYRSGNDCILFSADVDPEAGFHGVYLNIVYGEVMYYNDGWNYITVPAAEYQRMTVDTTPGRWQRLVISRMNRFDDYVVTLTDMATGVTQTSNPFNSFFIDVSGSRSNRMSWYTSTTLNVDFAIDNVWTQVSDPAATNVIKLSGVGPDATGVMVNTPLSQSFLIHYLPLGAGDVPELGVWTDNYFPACEYYVFNMDMAGGLAQYQDRIARAQNLQWSINYNGGGFLHTILGGTVVSFSYNGGNATALLKCFTTVYKNGTMETYASGAYQGFGNERCGTLSESYYQLSWDLATGTGQLTPTSQLNGDANGDGKVDVSDLGILAANYGTTSGATWEQGDFNGDHKVDVSDLGILAANYGTGTGATLDFNQDAKALGLSIDDASLKTETPETLDLGCGSMGLPLIAAFALMGLMIGKLEE